LPVLFDGDLMQHIDAKSETISAGTAQSPATDMAGGESRPLLELLTDAAGGALAGALATVPMTVFMELAHRRLPFYERYALPPRQITMVLARRAGLLPQMREPERFGSSVAAHFGYGSAMGGVYGLLTSRLGASGPVAGMGYGLAVWGFNYLGLLPALEILPPATEHPARRNALMIGAHLVWGALLGSLASLPRDGKHTHWMKERK
jgi:hypothetical protein